MQVFSYWIQANNESLNKKKTIAREKKMESNKNLKKAVPLRGAERHALPNQSSEM